MIIPGKRPGYWRQKNDAKTTTPKETEFTAGITKALRRAAKTARKTASAFGTPIYVARDGKVLAIKPKKAA